MPLPQKAPGGGQRRAHVHFVHNKTAKGKSWEAYIAGPCHWFDCHTKGRSKPCLHEMTSGELKCELCTPFDVPQCIGYQPLYTKSDCRPCFVVVHDYARDQIDALKLHHPVKVSRGEGAADTLAVTPLLGSAPKYHSTLAERMKPADLTETLLRVWKMPDLVEWYRLTHGATTSTPAASPPPPPPPLTRRKRDDNKPFTPMMQGAANKYNMPEVTPAEASLEDALERVKRREAAATNGNGKH